MRDWTNALGGKSWVMAVSREKKILRIDLFKTGRFWWKDSFDVGAVTIGQSPRNTFEISSGDSKVLHPL